MSVALEISTTRLVGQPGWASVIKEPTSPWRRLHESAQAYVDGTAAVAAARAYIAAGLPLIPQPRLIDSPQQLALADRKAQQAVNRIVKPAKKKKEKAKQARIRAALHAKVRRQTRHIIVTPTAPEKVLPEPANPSLKPYRGKRRTDPLA